MVKKFLPFIMLLALWVVPPSWGTTYYVDATDGSDSANGTSPETPWKTVSKVNTEMSSFNAGDSILFQRGETWSLGSGGEDNALTISCDGSSGSVITFGAYGSGAIPVFDQTAVSSGNYAVGFSGADYVTFENIRVTQGYRTNIQVSTTGTDCTYVTLSGVTSDNNRSAGYLGFEVITRGADGATHHITLTGCTSYNITHNCIRTSDGVEDLIIEKCDFYDFDHNAVDFHHDSYPARYNKRAKVRFNKIWAETSGEGDNGIFAPNTQDCDFYANKIYSLKNGADVVGIKIAKGNGSVSPTGNKSYANIIYDIRGTGSSYALWATDTVNNSFYNNTTYDNTASCIFVDNTGLSQDNNVHYADDSGNDCSLYGSDPKFVNAAAGNFELQDNSPAIDAGTDLGTGLLYCILPGATFGVGGSVTMVDPDNYGEGWNDGAYESEPPSTVQILQGSFQGAIR
jgi:hypothetical protein